MSKGNEPRIPRGKPPGPEYVTRAKVHEGTDKILDDLLANPHADVVCFYSKSWLNSSKTLAYRNKS